MYDPLVDQRPDGQASAPSFWSSEVKTSVCPEVDSDLDTDVLIIGAGNAGLSCAYHLAKDYSIEATVMDANQPSWGCSGRNAGFVLGSSGRLSYAQLIKKWGLNKAQRIHAEYLASIELTRELASQQNCTLQQSGYLKLAHNKKALAMLNDQAELHNCHFDMHTQALGQAALAERFCNFNAAGAIYLPHCFGLNPLEFSQGLLNSAQQAGAEVYGNLPALQIITESGGYQVHTPKATIRCNSLILTSNAYMQRDLLPYLQNRHFPVLSSVLVTKALRSDQLAQLGVNNDFMAMDTRPMKYYYRLLPDKRLLFGGRGAIYGKDADKPIYKQQLLNALQSTFPNLAHIQAEYFWSGWVSVSLDDMPRIVKVELKAPLFYAMGYCGSGLSFSTLAGKRLAQQVTQSLPDEIAALPFYNSQLPKYPLAKMRRLGLWGYYKWLQLQQNIAA